MSVFERLRENVDYLSKAAEADLESAKQHPGCGYNFDALRQIHKADGAMEFVRWLNRNGEVELSPEQCAEMIKWEERLDIVDEALKGLK